MKLINTDGIIINKKEYGDADLQLTVFTEIFGKVYFYIKGIRKSKKRDISAVDILSHTKLIIIKKGENYTLSHFEGITIFEKIKKDLSKISLAMYILEILNNILPENDRQREIYKLTVNSIKFLEREDIYLKQLIGIIYFLFMVIKLEGILFEKLEILDENLSELHKNIVICFLEKREKDVLKFEINSEKLIKLILILEKYININLETKINVKKYLLG